MVNEIISCNDAIAQEYLVESVVQVFPYDFHVGGYAPSFDFSLILECLAHLDSAVNTGRGVLWA